MGTGWKVPAGTRVWPAPPGPKTWKAPPGRRVWEVRMAAGSLDAGDCPFKAGSTEDYMMSFGDCPQAAAGVAISAFDLAVAAGGPTVAAQDKVGNYAIKARLTGTPAAGSYAVTGTVNWANGTVTRRTATVTVE